MVAHPFEVRLAARVKILQIATAAHGRTDLIRRDAMETAIRKALKERRTVRGSSIAHLADRNAATILLVRDWCPAATDAVACRQSSPKENRVALRGG